MLIFMELFFSDTDIVYNDKMTLEAVVALCSGTLYSHFSKSLAFPT